MKRTFHKSILSVLVVTGLLVLVLVSAGCTGTPGGNATRTPTVTATPTAPVTSSTTVPVTATSPSGQVQTIKVAGSTTVLPIAQKAAEVYMNDTPNVDIVVSGGGSGNGITQIGEKTIDIGMSSRDVTAAEMTKYPGFVITTVANDGVAIIVHPMNTVANLTLGQIRDIYAGNVTNWKAVGGPDLPIVVIGRDSASGTREFITTAVMGKTNYTKSMLEQNSNGGIKQSIATTPGAIGYVGLGYVDATVKQVPINVNGTLFVATVPNVLNHSYPLSRGLYMITNGQPTGLAKDYIGFILSARGQEIVEDEGFVPLP